MTDALQIDRATHVDYILRLADNSLVLGHRLSEWCGHGPILEEDIAMSNIALDLIGQARLLLTHAGKVQGEGKDEDALAFLRPEPEWRNVLLVEQPNGDFAMTMARQFLFDCFHVELLAALSGSADAELSAIAAKSLKEATYHRRHSGEWMIRMGDGTEESKRRVQAALDDLWIFVDELFMMDEIDRATIDAGIGIDLAALRPNWDAMVDRVLDEATLIRPVVGYPRAGGRRGEHSENLGYILAELQYMQRAYPGMDW